MIVEMMTRWSNHKAMMQWWDREVLQEKVFLAMVFPVMPHRGREGECRERQPGNTMYKWFFSWLVPLKMDGIFQLNTYQILNDHGSFKIESDFSAPFYPKNEVLIPSTLPCADTTAAIAAIETAVAVRDAT